MHNLSFIADFFFPLASENKKNLFFWLASWLNWWDVSSPGEEEEYHYADENGKFKFL